MNTNEKLRPLRRANVFHTWNLRHSTANQKPPIGSSSETDAGTYSVSWSMCIMKPLYIYTYIIYIYIYHLKNTQPPVTRVLPEAVAELHGWSMISMAAASAVSPPPSPEQTHGSRPVYTSARRRCDSAPATVALWAHWNVCVGVCVCVCVDACMPYCVCTGLCVTLLHSFVGESSLIGQWGHSRVCYVWVADHCYE